MLIKGETRTGMLLVRVLTYTETLVEIPDQIFVYNQIFYHN